MLHAKLCRLLALLVFVEWCGVFAELQLPRRLEEKKMCNTYKKETRLDNKYAKSADVLATDLSEIGTSLSDAFTANNLTALSAVLVYREQVLENWNFGTVKPGGANIDDKSIFRIASVTKLFTLVMLLKLRDEGVVSLNDPVKKFFPGKLEWKYPKSMRYSGPGPTLFHLATYTAGIAARQPPCPWMNCHWSVDEFLHWLSKTDMYAIPGVEQGWYSNTQMTLLGRALEVAAGVKWEKYVKGLMKDFGMTGSSGEPPVPRLHDRLVWTLDLDTWEPYQPTYQVDLMNPSSGGSSCTKDMAKFMISIMRYHASVGCRNQVLEGATLREWFAVRVGVTFNSAWGMPWETIEYPDTNFVTKGGSNPGMMSGMYLDPDNRIGLFFSTASAKADVGGKITDMLTPHFKNMASMFADTKQLTTGFGAKYNNLAAYQPVGDASNYIGHYEHADGYLTIADRGDGVLVSNCTVNSICLWYASNTPIISYGSKNRLFMLIYQDPLGPPPNMIAKRESSGATADMVTSFVLDAGRYWYRNYTSQPAAPEVVRVASPN